MQLKIRSDLFSSNSNLHYGTQAKNIQEDAKHFIIPDNKMVTLSMKRKRTVEAGSSPKKNTFSRYGKKDFKKMSAADILQEIDSILESY